MLKFRTMVDGADTQLEHLLAVNEGAGGMLFKMRQDPGSPHRQNPPPVQHR